MLTRIDHIGIAVQNIQEALAFYQDALGVRLELESDVELDCSSDFDTERGSGRTAPRSSNEFAWSV